jgi:hypothetical protein
VRLIISGIQINPGLEESQRNLQVPPTYPDDYDPVDIGNEDEEYDNEEDGTEDQLEQYEQIEDLQR